MQPYFAQFCMLYEKLVIGELDNKYKDRIPVKLLLDIIPGAKTAKPFRSTRCYVCFYNLLWCYPFILMCQLSFLNMYDIMPYVL